MMIDKVRNWPVVLLPLVLALASLAAVSCGGDGTPASAADRGAGTVRLGYFPNLTHATAIAGVEQGIFGKALAPDKLEVSTFNAGPAAVEALFSGALDATYIGPGPAINGFVRSDGRALRIVSGATAGGASLIVKPAIKLARQLKGKRIASPQLGGTQDVALRHWLGEQGFKVQRTGGGDVAVLPQENAQTLETFRRGQIDGAWVPEPWATRLRLEGGGKVLVDEKSLWPEGRFVTTHLVVRTEFLKEHPETVRRLLRGQVEANDFVNGDAPAAQKVVNDGIEKITTKRLKDEVIEEAWTSLEFTNDPIASSLEASARHARDVGLLDEADLDGIYDLKFLNEVLKSAGQKEITQ